jgi:hypothetical protein
MDGGIEPMRDGAAAARRQALGVVVRSLAVTAVVGALLWALP